MPAARLHLVVASHERRHGVGGQLEQAARAWAEERSVQQLVAGVQGYNGPALALYRARGYRDNAVVLIKNLS